MVMALHQNNCRQSNIFIGRQTKCSSQYNIQGSAIARQNFSNPLPMIRPFSARRKNCTCEKAGSNQNADHARKISIDHTVSTDGSRPISSQDFSPSFDVVGVFEDPPPDFAPEGSVAKKHSATAGAALNGKASQSEPPFLSHHFDRSTSVVAQNQRRFYTSSYRVGAPLQLQSPHASPKSNDPALQARIEAIRIQQQLLGENHPDVIFALSSLAKLHQKRGNYTEAASILRESQMRSTQAKVVPQISNLRRQNPQENPSVPTEISFPH